MQIQVTFRHTESSDAVRDYAQDKVAKIEKYLDGPVEAQVTLGVEKHRHEADVTILASGLKINGRETTGDLFSAIDLVCDKLEKQVKKYREKLKKFNRSERPALSERPYQVGHIEAESVVEDQPKVVVNTSMVAKPMDVDEAAMQLDLSDDEFLVFINARTEVMNVIYRRSDGNFGLIEPQ